MKKARIFKYGEGHSHRKKAEKPDTKGYAGVIDARDLTDQRRYDYDIRCLHRGCDCSHHFRKAVEAIPTTDPDPPSFKRPFRDETFVKDPSSSHAQDCPYDLYRLERNNEGVFTSRNTLCLKIDFKLGTLIDTDPGTRLAPLSNIYIQSAKGKIGRPFESLDQVAQFLTKTYGSLNDAGVQNTVLITQRNEAISLSEHLITEQAPSRFFVNPGQGPRHGLLKVKPSHDLPARGSLSDIIACEAIPSDSVIGPAWIQPIIICHDKSESTQAILREIIEQDRPVLLSATYFADSHDTLERAGRGMTEANIHIYNTHQLAALSQNDWSPHRFPTSAMSLDLPEQPSPAR